MMNKYDFNKVLPAVVIAPRESIIATMYTAIPTLVVGYSWMLLFE